MGEMRNGYQILFRKPKWQKPHGRSKHKEKVNIKLDLTYDAQR